MLQMFDLSGKVAIVTGGHSGIGRGIAEGLAEAGADIVVCARRLDRCEEACAQIRKWGVKALAIRCDVTHTDEVNKLVKTTTEEFGKIDILVNSAGVGGSEKAVVEMSDQDWDTTMDVNLRGAFLCSRAAAQEMMKKNEGKIINIASTGSFIAFTNMSAYCVAKGGLIQLTKVMALELVKYNIQVNAIAPGYFDTPMNREFFGTEAGKKLIARNIPIGRLGNVNELKGAVILLASSASSFMCGSCIVIDGGQTLR